MHRHAHRINTKKFLMEQIITKYLRILCVFGEAKAVAAEDEHTRSLAISWHRI